MKKIQCIPMLLIAALVLCSGISETFAQPPDPCTTDKKNVNAAYNGGGGLFVCASSVIPEDEPEGWEDWCDCHDDCYYIHIRNNISNCPGSSGDILEIRIALQNDSTSDDICIGGPFKQWGLTPWTLPWNVVYAGGTLPFPTDSCMSWGIDMAKAVDTKPPVVPGTNYDIQAVGNHWTAKVCGSRTITITVTYRNNMPPPQTWTFGPLNILSTPCPEYN